MKQRCFLFVLLILCFYGFAQNTQDDYSDVDCNSLVLFEPFFTELLESALRTTQTENPFVNGEPEAETPNQPVFANAPQWVKDLRRGEIVFFGSLPFTVFFSRTVVDLFRMSAHNWDRRYAPWPLASAGAVAMNTNELIWMFSIAASASVVISVADYFIVQKKRKTAATE